MDLFFAIAFIAKKQEDLEISFSIKGKLNNRIQ